MSKREKRPPNKLLIDFYMAEINDPNSSKQVRRMAAKQLDKLLERLDKLSEQGRKDRDKRAIAEAERETAQALAAAAAAGVHAPEPEPSDEDRINQAFESVLGAKQ